MGSELQFLAIDAAKFCRKNIENVLIIQPASELFNSSSIVNEHTSTILAAVRIHNQKLNCIDYILQSYQLSIFLKKYLIAEFNKVEREMNLLCARGAVTNQI